MAKRTNCEMMKGSVWMESSGGNKFHIVECLFTFAVLQFGDGAQLATLANFFLMTPDAAAKFPPGLHRRNRAETAIPAAYPAARSSSITESYLPQREQDILRRRLRLRRDRKQICRGRQRSIIILPDFQVAGPCRLPVAGAVGRRTRHRPVINATYVYLQPVNQICVPRISS